MAKLKHGDVYTVEGSHGVWICIYNSNGEEHWACLVHLDGSISDSGCGRRDYPENNKDKKVLFNLSEICLTAFKD